MSEVINQHEPKDVTKRVANVSKKKVLNLEHEREKDKEPVKGVFRFFAIPGGILKFNYRKYKGEKPQKFTLRDGEIATVPLGVAKHLNKEGWYPEYEYIPGMSVQAGLGADRTSPAMRMVKKVHRFAFHSLDFTNEEELNNPAKEIVRVENMPLI